MKINEKSSTKKSVDKKPKYDAEYEQTILELLKELDNAFYEYAECLYALSDNLNENETEDRLIKAIDKVADIILDLNNTLFHDVKLKNPEEFNTRLIAVMGSCTYAYSMFKIRKNQRVITHEMEEKNLELNKHLKKLKDYVTEYNTYFNTTELLTLSAAKKEWEKNNTNAANDIESILAGEDNTEQN